MKKTLGTLIPFLSLHLFCCGALLYLLITSGFLLLLSQEGNRKTLILPALLLLGGIVWLNRYHQKSCKIKEQKSRADHFIGLSLSVILSIIASLIFFIYFFLPWWI